MKEWSPSIKLDALVCGLPIERIDPERPYGALRGNATRAFGLANNLAKQGWRVGLIVEPGCGVVSSRWISENLNVVFRPDLARAAAVSQVLILCSTNVKTLHERVPEALTVVHPRKWLALCFDHNNNEDFSSLLRGVIGVSVNNDLVARNWQARKLNLPLHVVPYGVDENSYIDDCIVPVERPTAIWIGALRLPATLQRIVRFAEVNPECDVKVASGLIFDQSITAGEGSFEHPYLDHRGGPIPKAQFEAVLRHWCGRDCPANLHYLGSCPGENAQLLGSASLALGFSRRIGQQHDDSKVLEYLRSGLPVLADDGQPSCRFVSETKHGCVIPFAASDELLRLGFQQCLAVSSVEHRRTVAAAVGKHLGWPAVAQKLAVWIHDAMAAGDLAPVPTDFAQMPPVPHRASPGLHPMKTANASNQPHSPEVSAINHVVRPPLRLLYIPWIEGHTGALVKLLEAEGGVEFVPLPLQDLIPGQPGAHRSQIGQLAEAQPREFCRLLADLLNRVEQPVNALLMTLDWCSGLRDTVQAFRQAGFPTVLVPHESVFAQEYLYYLDSQSGINVPQAEMSLLWGGLQEDVFRRRGLPAEQMKKVGSPKLDFIRQFQSSVSRPEFYARWKLPGAKPTILFSMQPMDIQFDTPRALAAQNLAIRDCLRLCQQHGWQLIVRLPPARSLAIVDHETIAAVEQSGCAAFDGVQEGRHLATPHDAMFHADVVVSINSTMLLEAGLMGRPSISLGYVSCDQFWHRKGGLPLASNAGELEVVLKRALSARHALFSETGWRWIRWAFSPGEFEGNSARRILDYIAARWPEPQKVASVSRYLEVSNKVPVRHHVKPSPVTPVEKQPAFVSFLLPYIDRGQGPISHWVMQLQAAMFGPQRVAFIADEPYFDAPQEWGKERIHAGFRYRCVTREAWAGFAKYSLPRSLFADLENRSRSMLEAFRILLTEDYVPLREALEKIFEKMCRTQTPDAVLTWCHCPSLKLAAAKFGIPVIHNELGPLRPPHYQSTIYFDFKGVNGFTSAEEQMLQFAREAAGDFRPLSLEELREMLIVAPEKRDAGKQVPCYKAGAALQVEDDSNLLAFAKGMSNFELIFAARKGLRPEQILVRQHPHGHARYSDKLGVPDRSADSIEFLSRCEQVFTTNSSVAFECLLQDKPVAIFGESPAASLSYERRLALSAEERLLRLNWLFVGYLVPAARLFDIDYYRWRLTNPSLREIYERHLADYRRAPAMKDWVASPKKQPLIPAPACPPAKEKKSILFVSHDASRTGAPIFLLRLLGWLKANTNAPFKILLRQGGPLESEFRALGETFTPETFGRDGRHLADVGLVYSNTCTNGELLESLPVLQIPIVTHIHELDNAIACFGQKNWEATRLQTHHYIACADAVVQALSQRHGIAATRISRHYGGIPAAEVRERAKQVPVAQIRAALPLPADAFLIAACGSVQQNKGVDLFFQLAQLLQNKFQGTRKIGLVWVGKFLNEQQRQQLLHEVARLNLGDMLFFVGEQSNPHPFLNACDVFVLPSREDCFPLVMLEAATLGKPIVCFDKAGGAPEFCRMGGGVVVPHLDVPAMAAACQGLMNDDVRRVQIGRMAAQLAKEKFDVSVVCNAIWQELQTFPRSLKTEDILQRAEMLVSAGQIVSAVKLLRQHLLQRPMDIALWSGLGAVLLRQGDKVAAVQALAEACRLDPSNVDVAKIVASLLMDMNRIKEAAFVLRKLIQLNPSDVTVLCAQAACFVQTGEVEAAKAVYERVLQLEPQNAIALENLQAIAGGAVESNLPPQPCPVCEQAARFRITKNAHDYFCCPDCGTVFTPKIEESGIRTENNGCRSRHEPAADLERLRRLESVCGGRVQKMIDFGCGQGEFVALMRQRGIQCDGVDKGTLLKLCDLPDGSLDGITMVEVIEHLYQPHEIFQEFRRVLQPGGAVYIESSFADGQELAAWPYLDPAIGHCTVHTERSMNLLAAAHGFELTKMNNNVYTLKRTAAEPTARPAAPASLNVENHGAVQVSIVIPVFNKVEFTQKCLARLAALPCSISHEIIVVDDHSTDETESFCRAQLKLQPNLRYCRLPENRGFGRACNHGAEQARGQWLVFLNNDTEPETGWLEAAVARMQSDPSIGIVGAKLLYPDRTVQHCGIEFFWADNPDYKIWPLPKRRRARSSTRATFQAARST